MPAATRRERTLDEVLANVGEATELYLEALQEDGKPVPRAEEVVFKVAVAS